MGIVTKKGDKGKTYLFLGGLVPKDNLRVELDGELDELCSFIGMSKSLIKDKLSRESLEDIQEDLFILGAEVATTTPHLKRLKRRIDNDDVVRLEKAIDELEARRSPQERSFVLPGANLVSSTLDISRTMARRVERRAVTLYKKKLLKNKQILIYLNRLSDLFYLLARICEKQL